MSAPGVAVTGANGYVGSRVCNRLAQLGCRVIALARTPPEGMGFVRWSLDDDVSTELFRSNRIDSLVHCAYDFAQVAWNDIRHVNVEGSVRLLEAAHAAGVSRIVFISSVSAFPGCRSLYGKAKMQVEEAASRIGAVIVRPCLVWGEDSGGMFGALQTRARSAGLIPLVGSGNYPQYLVHEDDLSDVIARSALGEICERIPITAGAEKPWKLRELIAALAARTGRHPKFLPVPWQAAWTALKVAETVGLRPGFRSDSIISLVYQNPRPDFSLAHRLGLHFREFY